MPTVPVSVWEQIPVIIVFALLLAGMASWMVRAFSKAVADINAHYAAIIDANNKQWQQYFDARSETNKMVNDQALKKLEELTAVIVTLKENFEAHDVMERQILRDLLPANGHRTTRRNQNRG